MKRVGYFFIRWLPLLLCAALLVSAVRAVPASRWQTWGKYAALLSVGLQSPRESVLYAEEAARRLADETDPTMPASVARETELAATAVIPPKGDGGGAVSEQQIGGGEAVVGEVTVKNKSGVSFEYASLLQAGLPFEAVDTDEPQVLIVHTHACECYMSYYAGYYNDDDATRTTDNRSNVAAVGEVIAQELRAQGIAVLHDTTQHDSPAYTGAYTRSEATIRSYLSQYPSIRVVLDIHRDAMQQDDLTKIKPTVTVDGQKAAQVMLVVGGTNTAELPNDYCEENLRLGLQLHQAMETAYDGIMRPLYLVDARYNQGLLAGSLLIEVGTDANTLTEALYSGRLVGKQLASLLTPANS